MERKRQLMPVKLKAHSTVLYSSLAKSTHIFLSFTKYALFLSLNLQFECKFVRLGNSVKCLLHLNSIFKNFII